MRLSYAKQHDIQEAILNDLYNPPKQKIDDKKGALVLRNHAEWIKPLMPFINKLPDNILMMSESVELEVPFIDTNAEEYDKCEKTTWREYAPKPIPIMQKGSSYYNSSIVPIPLQDDLKEEVLALRLEEFNLAQEQSAMKKYLHTTLEANNTTTKLRKAFPSTFQKYIPPEPPRAPRQAKLPMEEPDAVELPDNLKQRMTENLLNN
jgi:hypothetical protein